MVSLVDEPCRSPLPASSEHLWEAAARRVPIVAAAGGSIRFGRCPARWAVSLSKPDSLRANVARPSQLAQFPLS